MNPLRYLLAYRSLTAANAARNRGDAVTAAIAYQKIIDKWGADFGIIMQLGNAQKDSRQIHAAKATYERALKLKPNNADCYLQLGHLMKVAGERAAAADYYKKSLEASPRGNPAAEEYERLKHDTRVETGDTADETHVPLDSRAKIDICFGAKNDMNGWDLSLPALVVCRRLHKQMEWRR